MFGFPDSISMNAKLERRNTSLGSRKVFTIWMTLLSLLTKAMALKLQSKYQIQTAQFRGPASQVSSWVSLFQRQCPHRIHLLDHSGFVDLRETLPSFRSSFVCSHASSLVWVVEFCQQVEKLPMPGSSTGFPQRKIITANFWEFL